MIVDIDKYKINKQFVQEWFLSNKQESIGRSISLIATTTMCPCIVVAYWIGEVTGWPQEVIDCVERLKKFYGYEDVINKPSGSPV